MDLEQKLQAHGIASLSDVELIALLLNDLPQCETCAQSLLEEYGLSLSRLLGEPLSSLRMVQGIGIKRAQRVAVAAELSRRVAQSQEISIKQISSSADVIEHFRPRLSGLHHEECWVLYLTSTNSVIDSQMVSSGGIDATVVDLRLIIRRAIELLATQIILIHNHPSGSAQPSREDGELTERVHRASELLNIQLLDHIIISHNEDFSFLQAGLL